MADYKVCILAGGVASQMGELTKHVNAAILPINLKGSISYIVEKFSDDVEIIVAVGHKKETVIDYLSIAHPEKKFTFVESSKFLGPGSGPGYGLLCCKEHLQCPFIFVTSDTIVLEDIPKPDQNWFGIAPIKETEDYCTIKMKNNLVYQLDDKIKTDNKFAFIGLAGIKDYKTFWGALEKHKENSQGIIRDIPAFKALIERKLVPIGFTWFDTGHPKNYEETKKNFSGADKKFDFTKEGELSQFLYFVNDRVIKYFTDPELTKRRVERAEHLKGLCPDIEIHKGNFFSYKKIQGHTLYNVLNSQILKDFLHWSKNTLWEKQTLPPEELKNFHKICKEFYYDKTMKRVQDFHSQNSIVDGNNNINGVEVPPLQELLSKIDWEDLSKGIPVRFHGDFKFPNILVTRDEVSQLQKFVLLDWRQDFGGLMKYGDIYYDLGKLYAGIILSDELIKEGLFSFDMSGSSVFYDYSLKSGLLEAKEDYETFLIENGFDLKKVKTLCALSFLNMSPLHKYPFNFMVYYLGKNMLYKTLNGKSKI